VCQGPAGISCGRRPYTKQKKKTEAEKEERTDAAEATAYWKGVPAPPGLIKSNKDGSALPSKSPGTTTIRRDEGGYCLNCTEERENEMRDVAGTWAGTVFTWVENAAPERYSMRVGGGVLGTRETEGGGDDFLLTRLNVVAKGEQFSADRENFELEGKIQKTPSWTMNRKNPNQGAAPLGIIPKGGEPV